MNIKNHLVLMGIFSLFVGKSYSDSRSSGNKLSAPLSSFSLVSSVAKYYQYQTDAEKNPEQLSEVTLSPGYKFPDSSLSGIINYSHNETDATQSDLDDPIITFSSKEKNITAALKGSYFFTGTIGLSKSSYQEKKQYGTLGLGYGLSLDSSYLKVPSLSISSSLSLGKAFQKSEMTTKEEPNVNVYSVSNNVLELKIKKFFAAVQFKFINSLKYDDDFSNKYINAEEFGFNFTKNFAAVVGHANKAKTMDDETGEFNIRVLDNESSYFYMRIDISI